MRINEAMESINLRFKSGNDVPVQRAYVTAAEWDLVRRYISALRRLLGHRVELQGH